MLLAKLRVDRIEFIHPFHAVSDDNVDILVHLKDSRCFSATVFTLENIATIMARHSQSGEGASGLYFWASDMIIVRQLDRASIETSVRHIMEKEGYIAPFEEVFRAD